MCKPKEVKEVMESASPTLQQFKLSRRNPFVISAGVALFGLIVAILFAHEGVSSSSIAANDPKGSTGAQPKKQRGMIIQKASSNEFYKAYKAIQSDYASKAFGANGWRLLNKKDGVEVSILELDSDPTCPYVKMTAIIPTPPAFCWNWLTLDKWEQNMPKMDPFYEGVQIAGGYTHRGVTMTLARKRTSRILAFGKRDFVFLSVADIPKKDGTLVSGTVTVQTPALPRQEGYTRAFQDSIAFYKPTGSNGESTDLTIVCRMDLNDSSEGGSGGAVPMWLYVKTIGVTATQSVLNMRKQLIMEKEERTTTKKRPNFFSRVFQRREK